MLEVSTEDRTAEGGRQIPRRLESRGKTRKILWRRHQGCCHDASHRL